MASQCAGPGFVPKRATIAMAYAMSGRVASAAQFNVLMAS